VGLFINIDIAQFYLLKKILFDNFRLSEEQSIKKEEPQNSANYHYNNEERAI